MPGSPKEADRLTRAMRVAPLGAHFADDLATLTVRSGTPRLSVVIPTEEK